MGQQLSKCPHCDKTFTQKATMETHAKSHETTDKFQCDKCDHKTNTKYNLNQHN